MTAARRSTASPVAARRRGASPSSSREAEADADFAIELLVSSLSARIREDLERIRPAIIAGFRAGADFKLGSAAAGSRLRRAVSTRRGDVR